MFRKKVGAFDLSNLKTKKNWALVFLGVIVIVIFVGVMFHDFGGGDGRRIDHFLEALWNDPQLGHQSHKAAKAAVRQ